MSNVKEEGFTIIEIVIVLAILIVLAAIIIPNFFLIQQRTDLNNGAQEFVGVLKSAQNRALASDSSSQYGVYINTGVTPNKYVLFKGASYAGRDALQDQNYFLPKNVEFYSISLGGGSEIVFNKLTSASAQSGSVSLRNKTDTSQNKTVYIANSGVISFTAPSAFSDANRVKDSRHVHFDYSRTIDTATENVVLTFDNSVTKIIPINGYLSGGNLDWSGTVNVGGQNQVVQVKTHRLNNPDTQFSIRRDARYNNKILKITISGDNSGYLAEYSADGTIITHTSIYASNFIWQ